MGWKRSGALGSSIELGELNITADSLIAIDSNGDAERLAYAAAGNVLVGKGTSTKPAFEQIGDSHVSGLSASKITSGVFADGRIPSLDASKITTGQMALARGGTGQDFSSLSGKSGQVVKVNSAEDGMEIDTAPVTPGSDGDQVYLLDTTKGNYSEFSDAVGSSEADLGKRDLLESDTTLTDEHFTTGAISNAFDEDLATNFQFGISSPAAPTFVIDFGAIKTRSFTIKASTSVSGTSPTFALQKSDDDVSYTTITSGTSVTNPVVNDSFRYLKFQISGGLWGGGDIAKWIIYEIDDTPEATLFDDVQQATYVLSDTGKWQSDSENNPNIYVDAGSAQEVSALLINVDRTITTETEFEIRASTDVTFSTSERIRTLLVSDFTDDVDRFVMIPRLPEDRRYFQIYGKSTGVVLAINRFMYIAKTDWDRRHHHYPAIADPTDNTATEKDSN